MKTSRKLLAGLILAAGIGGTALAQPGMGMMKGGYGCDGSGPLGKTGRMAGNFDPAERLAQRLDYMKNQIKITAAQEPLWHAYATKKQARAGQGMQALRDPANAHLPAPERMAKRQAAMEQHLAGMKEVHESFTRLYAALTPEQQAIADRQATRMGPGGKGGMGPGRMAPPQG